MKGYGLLISRAREAAGMDVAALSVRMGQSVTTIRGLENEDREPSVRQINALVSTLPISAESLLEAMGVNLSLPLAARIPRPLAEYLGAATPEQQQALMLLLGTVAARGSDQR